MRYFYACIEQPCTLGRIGIGMALGDILVRQHVGFRHFAFEGPNGSVIEYTKRYGPARVTLTTIAAVAAAGPTVRRPYPANARFTPEDAYRRLLGRVGEQRYDVIHNNCESLLNWAIYDNPYSPQGHELATVGKVVAGVSVLALVVAAFDG